MALIDYLSRLSKDNQHTLAIMLIKLALPIWNRYADKSELTYRDTVVGLQHKVNRNLLTDCIIAAEDYLNSSHVEKIPNRGKEIITFLYNELREPIVALQDHDWELPYEVETTFYAVYNLIGNLNGEENTLFNEPRIYVSINQAADALTTSGVLTFDEINEMLVALR